MEWLYVVVGALILVAVSVDILWTTLWVEGSAGPLTAPWMNAVWQTMRRVAGSRDRALALSGPLILGTTLVLWIALLWGGWTLVFAGGENALLDTRKPGPVSWAELFYFTGYSVFTLGNGDFSPQGGAWQLATVLATASGMLFVTLSVTYVLSVLGAVTQKRSFASNVTGLGERSDRLLRESWNGERFEGLELPLNTITSELNTLTSNHKAYPVLHYFYSADPTNSPAVAIVVLDEFLTTLRFGIPEEHRPASPVLANARSSVLNYLTTLKSSFVDPADRTPPALELESVRDVDIPTVDDEAFADALDDVETRRRQLLGLVESDLREWPNRER